MNNMNSLILSIILILTSFSFADIQREYYPSGKIMCEGSIKNDDSIGTWNWFYENGKLSKTTKFGQWHSKEINEYNKNGKIFRFEAYDKYGRIKKREDSLGIRVYEKGILHYLNGINQWIWKCDTIIVNENSGARARLCGYSGYDNQRIGLWHITYLDYIENEEIAERNSYAVYDTLYYTSLKELRSEFCSKMGNSKSCFIDIKTENKTTLYSKDENENNYSFSSSLEWNSSMTYFYSSIAPRLNSPNDCSQKALSKDFECHKFTFKVEAERHIEEFNKFK